MRRMTTILVTGGLGFIGGWLVRFFLSNSNYSDVNILNVDYNGLGSHPDNVGPDIRNDKRYTFVSADINSIDKISEARDIDIMINVAAESHVDRSINDPFPFIHSNYEGTFSLLEHCRKRNISRFLQVSTDEVYGETIENFSFGELDCLNPTNPYSSTKAAADLLVKSYYQTYGLPVVITRSSNNFGPNQFPEKLIPRTIIRILLDLPISLYGNGRQIRDWIYVMDNIKAIELVSRKGKAGDIYNISASNLISNIDLVERISSLTERLINKTANITFTQDRPAHDRRYCIDSSKITTELGWRDEENFDKALEDTVVWYLDNRGWWNDLVDPFVIGHPQWKQETQMGKKK
jgi:dTDP-glucose 4,6-dehydratase